VSTILNWDVGDYQKQKAKVEKSLDAPGQDHLQLIKEYAGASREHQEKLRSRSSRFCSIF
jgi:hypothetical protein